MKVLKLLAVTAALSASGLAMADGSVVDQGYAFEANQLIPTGARLEVGTTGYGGALLWTANPYVGLALGYNGGDISWSDDLKINGSKYDLDMDNKLAYLNAEIRPWGASQNALAQGLYVAAGVGYVDNDYDVNRNIGRNASFKVDGSRFNAGLNDNVSIKGNQKYDNDIAPYLGFGFAPKINKNFGVFGEIGAYYTGNPTVQLVSSNPTLIGDDGRTLGKATEEEAKKISNDDKYKWLPVGKVGVSYHW
ncbi:ornithine uptake porin CarO [Acinetobacter bereziniae]|uniref:ornithine uptake porin CarO n=1 Tax=Acinetobacter bereziniae TaxID=106648 RepID=UPI0012505A37|nr:ornithine uptake porin CarO [Acinetobacter bereziniae]